MLSRLYPAARSSIFMTKGSFGTKLEAYSNNLFKIQYAASSQTSTPTSTTTTTKAPYVFVEGPERDLVNFPRPKRAEYPGKVRLGFLPEEWFSFFYKKTGVTGPYVFGAGLITYLMSKEIYVIEHEFWNGVSLFIMLIYAVKKFGPGFTVWVDKEVDNTIANMYKSKNQSISHYDGAIAEEKKAQWQAEGQNLLIAAKKENTLLQLEAEYRKRIQTAYVEVKKRLDYQLNINNLNRQTEHKHTVNWMVDQVMKSITPQQEQEALKQCIADLKIISTRM